MTWFRCGLPVFGHRSTLPFHSHRLGHENLVNGDRPIVGFFQTTATVIADFGFIQITDVAAAATVAYLSRLQDALAHSLPSISYQIFHTITRDPLFIFNLSILPLHLIPHSSPLSGLPEERDGR